MKNLEEINLDDEIIKDGVCYRKIIIPPTFRIHVHNARGLSRIGLLHSKPSPYAKAKWNKDEIGRDWTDGKVKEGVLPLPVDSDSKVVNQLTQVANDSEENVSKIFDVLSDILDNNNYLQNNLNSQSDFLSSQIKLLQSMNTKFPEIDIFKTNLDKASILESEMKDLITNIDNKNMQIFEAMELMQFNDINRQKIERVMSVIKKLSNYLSNLFEDESNAPEVSVAKHIHGDKEHDLAGDDLDSLINEFGK